MADLQPRADEPDALSIGRYRYEAAVKVVVAADGLDEALRMQQQIADVVRQHTNERVVDVTTSMLDLKHRPDLDGSLKPRSGGAS